MDQQKHLLEAITTSFSPINRYQKIIVALFCLIWIQLCYLCMIGSFVFMNPLFQCEGKPETEFNACSQLQKCKIINSYTATYYTGLYCDREEERETIQSSFCIGVVIGLFFIPAFSDWKGRRMTIILSSIACFFGAILITIGVFINSVFLMIFGQIIAGCFFSGITILTYIITAEFCSDAIRQFATLLYNGIWGFSQASFILIYYFMPEWYNFLFLLVIIPLVGLVVLLYFFILESPLFCIFNLKNSSQYQKVIQKLAIFNQPTTPSLNQTIEAGKIFLVNQQQRIHNSNKKSVKKILTQLFTYKKYVKAIIFLTLIYSGFNFSYFGAQMCLERIGLNFGINMVLVGLSELVANLVCGYFIHKIPRKTGLLVTLIVGSCLGLLFLIPAINNNKTVQTFIVPFYRMASVTFFAFTVMLQTESFDSSVKSTAVGLVSGLGKIVNMIIPFFVSAMNDHQINPIVASSVVFFILSFGPTLLIEQTKSIENALKTEDIQKLSTSSKTTLYSSENSLNSNLINSEQNFSQQQQQ